MVAKLACFIFFSTDEMMVGWRQPTVGCKKLGSRVRLERHGLENKARVIWWFWCWFHSFTSQHITTIGFRSRWSCLEIWATASDLKRITVLTSPLEPWVWAVSYGAFQAPLAQWDVGDHALPPQEFSKSSHGIHGIKKEERSMWTSQPFAFGFPLRFQRRYEFSLSQTWGVNRGWTTQHHRVYRCLSGSFRTMNEWIWMNRWVWINTY